MDCWALKDETSTLFRGKHVSNLDHITEYPDRSFMVLDSLSGTRNNGLIPSRRKAFYFIQIVQNTMGVPSSLLFDEYRRFYRAVQLQESENDCSPTSGADNQYIRSPISSSVIYLLVQLNLLNSVFMTNEMHKFL